MMDGEPNIDSRGVDNTPAEELKKAAVDIYNQIVETALIGTQDRHIWIQGKDIGNVDYPEANWRVNVVKKDNLSDKERKKFSIFFTPEEFDKGVFVVRQGYMHNPEKPNSAPKVGQGTKILVVQTEGGYKAVNVKRMGLGKAPALTEVNLSEEVEDAITRVSTLLTIPGKILDRFGSYEEFVHSVRDGLQGKEPFSGVITYDVNGLNVFGGRNGQRLPDEVKLLEIERRRRRE